MSTDTNDGESPENTADGLLSDAILMGQDIECVGATGARHAYRPFEYEAVDGTAWIHYAEDHTGEHLYSRMCETSAVRLQIELCDPEVRAVDPEVSVIGRDDDGS